MYTPSIYSLPINPEGTGYEVSPQAKIYFPNQKIKDLFVVAEGTYCYTFEQSYRGATAKNRESKREVLLAARADFAVKQGYAPLATDSSQWYFFPENVEE